MVPDQVSRWVPRPFDVLGTDGFGRSDTRAKLRGFFEVDAHHIVVAVLAALARAGRLDPEVAAKAIRDADIDPDVAPPWQR
jgi:pyruvate dehydrogenase E1 component